MKEKRISSHRIISKQRTKEDVIFDGRLVFEKSCTVWANVMATEIIAKDRLTVHGYIETSELLEGKEKIEADYWIKAGEIKSGSSIKAGRSIDSRGPINSGGDIKTHGRVKALSIEAKGDIAASGAVETHYNSETSSHGPIKASGSISGSAIMGSSIEAGGFIRAYMGGIEADEFVKAGEYILAITKIIAEGPIEVGEKHKIFAGIGLSSDTSWNSISADEIRGEIGYGSFAKIFVKKRVR